ncbi:MULTISPECIES: transcription antitermination factor NusB [Shewanella]|jgi:N utilization substance protein B|uniref:Transcription antitermination protein NusB n=2 Tax=Shewanella frigidimarina TaxID=56812 RepID=NUSB_SHEFN|nr:MULTISPECIES: transcription antitermination factor NusB [Shewanella]Q086C3.1 RecName: Full=Transcription antitermination protein NusB; AltName: Full=Antitermination factor NusB [Shewanella frigidimarina NCIMB 400]ABI70892.1 NusB antitermination factor [Shewanella frigidimarina NCIMB 400]KVX01029.1 N utilization substance protein B [Shewanella frigidimarina]MBB1425561.1 transcription antitermination factor NusB [Shewanella sp. SG44-2]PKI08172.1 N utilization substance protein B [Shewanella s|tara:strand:- start:4286 stop:4690 length:405 start_codon:yes stop_codon:yes gene_type:complete
MKPSERRKARRLAVQAIYSWQLSQNKVADVEHEFLTEQNTDGVDVAYFRELLTGVASKTSQIDELLKPHLDRKFEEVSPVEKAIVRLATYELTFRKDVPFKVAINEGIELAKAFGAEDSHKFVNGLLDKLVKHK